MVEARAMQDIGHFQHVWAPIWVLLVTVAFAVSLAWLVRGGYPILGMLRFFSDRRNFYLDGVATGRLGHFSFCFGKHHIIGVSGLEGRKAFYESNDLDISEG